MGQSAFGGIDKNLFKPQKINKLSKSKNLINFSKS